MLILYNYAEYNKFANWRQSKMDNFKETKTYKIFKKIFFTIKYQFLFHFGHRDKKYYYSKWVKDEGDTSILVEYPLNPKSTVIDVGGYTGNFSDKILKLYNPQLIILEPVKKYFKILKNKYSQNKNVSIYDYGLSKSDSVQKIFLSNDGTSLFKRSDKTQSIRLIDSAKFFKKYNKVDLVSINIEGAEYDVLDRLIDSGMIKRIKYLQVQFHSFVPESKKRRGKILKELSKTHTTHFSYPFVWESFKLKLKPSHNKTA